MIVWEDEKFNEDVGVFVEGRNGNSGEEVGD